MDLIKLMMMMMMGIVHLPQSCQFQELDLKDIILDQNVTGILGEEMYLQCLYLGNATIVFSAWYRLDSFSSSKRVAGYKFDGSPFNFYNFYIPASHSNLTVKVNLVHLNMEGQYSCMFSTDTEENKKTTYLSILARPYISTYVEEEVLNGTHYQSASCLAWNAKPIPVLSWEIMDTLLNDDSFSIHSMTSTWPNGTVSVVSVLRFPSHLNNKSSITCVIKHPTFTEPRTTEVQLKTFELSSIRLANSSAEYQVLTPHSLELNEGDSDTYVSMAVTGNVPRYDIECIKDGEPLPEGMEVIESSLIIKGPIGFNHTGRYQCQASYYRHSASVEFDIKVNFIVLRPAVLSPNVSISLRKKENQVHIECLASDASPTTNMSWVLPRNITKTILSNIMSTNRTYLIRNVLILPACLYKELTVGCIVDHPALTKPETREIILPACVSGYVTMNLSTSWEDGMAYTEVTCTAENVTSEATVTWQTENCTARIGPAEFWVQKKPGVIQNTAHLSVLSYTGCTVICMLEQMELEEPIRKSVRITAIGAPISRVVLWPQTQPTPWAAVCEYQGAGVIPNISWTISDTRNILPSRIYTTINDIQVQVESTYQFSLIQHEGKSLTCVIQKPHEKAETLIIHVPKYFITSIVVLNKTTPHGKQGQRNSVDRVTLKGHVSNQRILFKMIGNAPVDLRCFRPDGLPAHTTGMSLVFDNSVSELDAGLYKCNVSWYHHEATIFVQVDIIIPEVQNLLLILICFSSASAIAVVLLVMLCIFCNRSKKAHLSVKDRKGRESLSALMQDPCSPEMKKAEVKSLTHYSIVIDVKSTV